jgi:hypothetical protein
MHNRKAITPSKLWESILDYDLWPVGAFIQSMSVVDMSIDLRSRIDCVHPSTSSTNLFNSHSEATWLQPSE